MEQQEGNIRTLIDQCIERTREAAAFQKTMEEQIRDMTETTDVMLKQIERDIRKLEAEASRLRDGLENAVAEKKEQKEAWWQRAHELRLQINDVLYYMEIAEKRSQDLSIENPIEYRGYDRDKKFSQDLGYIFEDTYMKMKAYIAMNEKPKNKFVLLVVFKAIDALFVGPENRWGSYFSGAGINGQWARIKEFPSKSDALLFFEKHVKTLQHAVVQEIVEAYEGRKAGFEDAQRICTLDDLLDLKSLLIEWNHHDIFFDRIEEGIIRWRTWKDEERITHVALDKERRILHIAKTEEEGGTVENYFSYYFPLRRFVKVEYNGEQV